MDPGPRLVGQRGARLRGVDHSVGAEHGKRGLAQSEVPRLFAGAGEAEVPGLGRSRGVPAGQGRVQRQCFKLLRRDAEDAHKPQTQGNHSLEISAKAVPLLLHL